MRDSTTEIPWLERITVLLAITLPWCWLFVPVLWHGEVLAFRDAGNFYYPQYQWQWQQGIPFWNPYDGLGTPVLADATSSLFYPGRVLFALPVEKFSARFNLYLMLHVLLAASSSYFVARRWHFGRPAAALSAVSFAYGGSVLSQYCNVVFLVSAAWLPLGTYCSERMLTRRDWRYAIALGIVMALMVLGGDPQTAYHVLILTVLCAMWHAWTQRRAQRIALHQTTGPFQRGPRADSLSLPSPPLLRRLMPQHWRRWRPALLIAAVATGMSLAAVQILPSWEWTRRSDRAAVQFPRNVFEAVRLLALPDDDAPDWSERCRAIGLGLFQMAEPFPGSHDAKVYRYSVGPWRLVELVWPNFSGQLYPVYRRWLSTLPAESSVWTPTLYGGLLPLVLAAWVWFRCPAGNRRRWTTTLVLVGTLGSFGWFGVGWIVEQLRLAAGTAGHSTWNGEPVGGLYWILVVLLPGYAMFRYPAKWFVFASWGISLLAGWGADRIQKGSATPESPPADSEPTRRSMSRPISDDFRSFSRWMAVLGLSSLVLLGAAVMGRPLFFRWLQDASPNDAFGPLYIAGASRSVGISLMHTASIAGIGWLVLRLPALQRLISPSLSILVVSAIELTLANQWLVATVPADILESGGASWQQSAVASELGSPPLRVAHREERPTTPPAWRETSDPRRLAEMLQWEQQTLIQKHHLLRNVDVVDAPTTISSAELLAFLQLARSTYSTTGPVEPTLWEVTGVDQLISTAVSDQLRNAMPRDETSAVTGLNAAEPFTYRILDQRLPRAWIVHQAQSARPRGRTRKSIADSLRQMWLSEDGRSVRDPRKSVFVEINDLPTINREPSTGEQESSLEITEYQLHSVEFDVSLPAPGYLVLSDLYDPQWTARIHSRDGAGSPSSETPCVCVNGLFRGVWLPAGRHHVTMSYRPWTFHVGATISLVAVACVVACFTRLRGGAPA